MNETYRSDMGLSDFVRDHAEHFKPDFPDWLKQNPHVFYALRDETFKVAAAGWKHYSARTIIEVLRHRSAVREISGPWKINNDRVPDLARLMMLRHPGYQGFFQLRTNEDRPQ